MPSTPLMRQSAADSAAAAAVRVRASAAAVRVCAYGCFSNVGAFFVIYVSTLAGLGVAANAETTHTIAGKNVYLLLLTVAPPIVLLVFLSRTFGTSIDRCQVSLTFFTAILWMPPLLFLISMLAEAGLLRAAYSLDSACGECYERGLCADTCAFAACANGSRVGASLDGACSDGGPSASRPAPASACCALGTDCADCGRREVPLSYDSDPSNLACVCGWRHVPSLGSLHILQSNSVSLLLFWGLLIAYMLTGVGGDGVLSRGVSRGDAEVH